MQKLFTFLACLMVMFSLNAQKMASGFKNYSTFTTEQQKRVITPELEANTPENLRSHPEYGILPYGLPNTNCYEVLSKRTIDSRYYQDLSNPKKIYLEKANGPIHYLNAQNQLISIDTRLRPMGNGIYAAPFQPQPKGLNVAGKYATISVNGVEMKFNRNLHLWHEAADGTRTDLGLADWSKYIVGDEGMQVLDIWDGVNMHVSYRQDYVKTDFLVYKQPTQNGGFLVITDDIEVPNGYTFANDPKNGEAPVGNEIMGNVLIMNEKHQNVFTMGTIMVFDAKIEKKRQRRFPYRVHNDLHQYEIRIPMSYLQDPDRKYPVTIDPAITGPVATYGAGNIPFIDASTSYCTFNTSSYCSGNLAVQVPANVTLTNGYYATRYTALDWLSNGGGCGLSDCWMSEASFAVYNQNCGSNSGLLTCGGVGGQSSGDCYTIDGFGNGSPTVPGYVQDPDIVSPTNACNPPSCTPYNVTFQMRTYSCFSCSGGCQTDCHYMPSGIWKMYLEGETLGGAIAISGTVSGTNTICLGQSATLTTSPIYGVPAYTYSWSNGVTGTNTITVSPAVTTSYTGYVTDACGNQVSGSLTVVVNQPPAPNPSNNSPICPGSTLTFSASGGGTYNWAGPAALINGTSSNPFITNVSAVAAGTYTVTVTGANTCSASATTTVVVNSAPTSLPSSNSPICTNGTISLTGAGSGGVSPYTYAWAGPGYSSNLQSPNITNATTANSGTYTLTVTGNNNCTATATTSVTVNAPPPVTAGSNSPICIGGTINLQGGGAVSYAWSGPNGYSSNLQSPSISNATILNSGVYTVVGTDASNCTASATVNVTVNSAPVAVVSSNSPICLGGTLNLSATNIAGATYVWAGPNAFAGVGQSVSVTNTTVAAAGIYSVTVTDANSCTASFTSSNVVINSVNVSTTANITACTNGSLTLSASPVGGAANYTYNWAGPGFSSTLQNPQVTASATVANQGTYTVTITDGNSCTASATTAVTVLAGLPVTASSNSPVCLNGTILLTSGGAATYAWTGPSAYSSSLQNPSITNATAAMAGVYTVVGTSGSCTASATVNVVINNPPVATVTTNSPICIGGTLNLSATNIAGATYAWAGPNAFVGAGQSVSVPNATAAAAGTYSVTVTDATGCTASFTSSSVVMNTVGASTPATITACTNGSLDLSSAPIGGAANYTYNWSGPGFTSTLQNPQVTTTATAANQGTYIVTITDGNGCTASASTVVTVLGSLPVTAASNSPVCTNGAITLTAAGATTYGWSGPNGYLSALQNPTIANAGAINAGVYTVVGVSGSCTASATVNVTINPLPVATVTTNSPICAGSTLNLSATNIAGATYAWSGPNAYVGAGQSVSIPNATTAAAGIYSVTVTDASNCSASFTSSSVTINTATTVVTSNSPVCLGGTLTLSATNAVTAVWTGPSGGVTPPINNVTLADAGTYNVSITDVNGCTTTGSTNVVINTAPVTTASSSGTICAGATLNLSVSAAGSTTYLWAGPNSFSSNVINPSITNATVAATGTYSVTITTASGCTASTTTTATVNPAPNAIASSNSPVCLGGTVSLTSSGGTTYQWSGPGNFSSNLQNPTFGNAGASNGGTYTVTVSVGTCSASITTNVVVGAALISDFTYPLSAYCQTGGTAVPIMLNNGINGSYTANPATLSLNSATGVITLGTSPVGTYTVYNTIPSSGGCAGDRDSVTISIGAPQDASFSYGANTFCQTGGNNPTSNLASGNYIYTAVDPTDVLFLNPTTGAINLAASSVGVYQVCNTLPANGGCAPDTACQIVVIEAAPNAEFTYPAASFCKLGQNPDVLHLLGGTDGVYSSTPSGLAINANNGTIDLLNSAAGTYTITNTVASGSCAVATATQTITITNGVDAEFTYDKKAYCKFNTDPVISHTTGTNGVYTYTVSSGGPNLALNPATGDINLSLSDFGTYEVRNTIPANGGCPPDTHVETIVIENGPDAEFHYDKTTYCGNQEIPVILHTSGTSGVYSYTVTSGGPTLLLNPTTGSVNLNLSDYGTYVVKNVVNGSGACAADSETVSITYAAPPTAVISPTGVIDLCATGTVQLQAGGGLTYQWVQNNVPVFGATTPTFAATQAGNYMVIAYGAFGCADSSQVVTLSNQTLPQANITANGPTTFCANNGVTLSTSLAGNYEWIRDGVATGITTPQLYVTDGANYQVIVTNFCGTDTSVIVKTQIAPAPIPNFVWSPDYVYQGQPVIFTDSSKNAATWSWNFGDSHILYDQNPTNVYNEAGEYVVWMHIWDAFGCDSFIAKNLTVHNPDALFVPNVFTPNGDGAFDTWQIGGDGYKTFYVKIYDRWGVQVFESNDITKSWNGNTQGGRACQNGVYFYYMNLTNQKDEKMEMKGNVTLIR